MASEEIESPPYPGEGTNNQVMYNLLKELRKWVVKYRDDANDEVGQEIIPHVIKIPVIEAYSSQPIIMHYSHFMMLKRIREEWDHLVRMFETDWDCQSCMRQRVMIMQSAAIMLNNAFTPYEVREMRSQKDAERLQRGFERLTAHLNAIMEPGNEEEETR